jgi:hypothetical protein
MLTYTLPAGCRTTSLFTVNPPPAINMVNGGGSYCAGSGGISVGTDGSVPGYTYRLYRSATPVITMTGTGGPLNFGNYTIDGSYTMTATTTAGCAANMPGMATVTTTPLVMPGVFVTSGMGDSLCAGTLATFTAAAVNGGTAPVYQWSVNGGTPVSGTTSFSYTPADGDVITATLTSNAACASPSTVTNGVSMTVITNLTPTASILAGPSSNVCSGTLVHFTATATNGGTAPEYAWYRNTLHYADGPSVSFVPANGDVIVAHLLSNYRCLTTNDVASNTLNMTVSDIYTPSVTVQANPGTTVPDNQAVTFTAMVSDGGPTPHYQWVINHTPMSGANGTTFTASHLNDGDTVSCVVKGTGDCGQTTAGWVVMHITTGVAHAAANNGVIRLIPNPNSGTFTISGTTGSANDEDVTIEVTDMLGQAVYSGRAGVRNGAISEHIQLAGNLANGMYLLSIRSASGQQTLSFMLQQ